MNKWVGGVLAIGAMVAMLMMHEDGGRGSGGQAGGADLLEGTLSSRNVLSVKQQLLKASSGSDPRVKMLKEQASKEAALARLEDKQIKTLKKELSALRVSGKKQMLNGASDMQNGQRTVGAGYWDKEHHDDSWKPVDEIYNKLVKRSQSWEKAEQDRESSHQDDLDSFVDVLSQNGAINEVSNEVVQENSEESEFSRDDTFVPPPSAITPNHRLPMQTYLPWEQSGNDLLGSN
eukprot:766710-Hanusia_phi.AAC.8